MRRGGVGEVVVVTVGQGRTSVTTSGLVPFSAKPSADSAASELALPSGKRVQRSLTTPGTFSAYDHALVGIAKRGCSHCPRCYSVQHVHVLVVSQGEALLQRSPGSVQGGRHRTRP